MAELRWLLLLLGIGVIIAVYLYTRYKPEIESKIRGVKIRREPTLGGQAISEQVQTPEPISADPAEPAPAATRKVVAIRLMATDTAGFPADQLVLSLREKSLRHGELGIFHRTRDESEEADMNAAVFSVASLVEPGSFDLTRLKNERYPGVSIFMILPGPLPGVSTFDDMMDFARAMAKKLDGYLLDEQGGTLSVQRERYIREEIIQFEHRGPG